MVRAVSGYDYDKALAVLDWPLTEVLVCYLEGVVKPTAVEAYHVDLITWAPIAPWSKNAKPPKPPKILE